MIETLAVRAFALAAGLLAAAPAAAKDELTIG